MADDSSWIRISDDMPCPMRVRNLIKKWLSRNYVHILKFDFCQLFLCVNKNGSFFSCALHFI